MTTPVSKPMLRCTLRLTISGSGASPLALSRLVSNAMALSICGSPANRAKTKTSRPATMPTSIPRTRRVRAILGAYLVTGKAEEMASVVYKFVNCSAVHHRGGTLLRTDEIDRQQHQETAKDCPGQ